MLTAELRASLNVSYLRFAQTGTAFNRRIIMEQKVQRYSRWFLLITAVFVTCLITANIIAVKMIAIGGLVLPAAVIIFPISYIIGDILTEVYGYASARRVIWLGFFCNVLAVVAIWGGQRLPAAGFWDAQASYERILGYTPRLLIASFLAYLVGEFSNSFVLAKMKIATRGRWLWSRTRARLVYFHHCSLRGNHADSRINECGHYTMAGKNRL